MQLRPYQTEAIAATWDALRNRTGGQLVVLPTGAGKSCVVASLCRTAVDDWKGRVLVLTHVKELIGQLHETLLRLWPMAPCGINSAGLKRRETDDAIVIASIQSSFRSGTELGRFDLVIIDEVHLVPKDGDGMYLTLLSTLRTINPDLRLVGLTATPFRLDSGWLYGDDALFNGVCYEAKVRDLIDQGFLCKLRGKNGGAPDLTNVHIRGGEYIAGELQDAVNTPEIVNAACDDIARHGADRQRWLAFCCGVEHAFMVADALTKRGITNAIVIGDTPSAERAESIRAYKAGELRCLVSVGALTTGIECPDIDMIALLRPSKSPGLYYQMVGRGLRISPSKQDCLVLDFADCIATHGPIDCLRITDKTPGDGESKPAPTKTCPQCSEILPLSSTQCNFCGYEFPRETAKHDTKAADASPLSKMEDEWVDVKRVDWTAHNKKGAPPGAPKTLRIIYEYGYGQSISEYVCIEHSGYARQKAEKWWLECTGSTDIFPADSANAVIFLDALKREGKPLRLPKRLLIRFGGQWPELIGRECTVITAASEPTQLTQEELDEIPF